MLASVICFSGAFAQTEKEIKEAKKAAQSVLKNVKQQLDSEEGSVQTAFGLIQKAMTNEYTKNQAQTWELAGDVYHKLYLEENNKASRNQPHDTVAMYDNFIKMYECYNRCDSLQAIPNEKGKTSTELRDKMASTLSQQRLELINGGIFYFNHRHDYPNAYRVFSKYYDICDMPMIKDLTEGDLMYQDYAKQFAYFTTLAARQMDDFEKVLKYCDLGAQDEEYGQTCYQLKCEALKELGRTDEWIEALKEGVKKYPTEDFYSMQLVLYYDQNGKLEEMESFVNDMIKVDPEKAYNYYIKGYLKQNQKNYAEAIEAYKTAIEKDETLIEAYINEGLCYMFDAQVYMDSKSDVKFNSAEYKEMMAKEKTYYENALPLFEKVREMDPNDTDKWGLQLYSIYYKLNMNKELDKMETILKAEGMLD